MTHSNDLKKLQDLSRLMMDHRLARLRETAEGLARSRHQLEMIDQSVEVSDLPPVTGDVVACTYQRWVDLRRVELNALLARQTAEFLEARGQAEKAFGQFEAIKGVSARLVRKG